MLSERRSATAPNEHRAFQVQIGCEPGLRSPRSELAADLWLGPDPSSYPVKMTIPNKKVDWGLVAVI